MKCADRQSILASNFAQQQEILVTDEIDRVDSCNFETLSPVIRCMFSFSLFDGQKIQSILGRVVTFE